MFRLVFAALARAVLARRLLWAGLLFGVVLATLAGAPRVVPDFSVQAFFGGDDPEIERLHEFQEIWGPDDDTILVIVEAGGDDSILTREGLRAIQDLATRLEREPDILRVQAITNVAILVSEEPGEIDVSSVIETVPETGSSTAAAFQAFRDRLLAHPLFVPALLSKDGRASAMLVELSSTSDDVLNLEPRVRRVREVIAAFEGREGLRFRTAGIPAVRADFFVRLLEEQGSFVPLVMLVASLLLFLLLKRPHAVIAPGVAALVPAAMVFGVMGYTGEPLGVLNQSYFTLLPVIAIADAVHMVSRFHEEVRRLDPTGRALTPELRSAAIVNAVSEIGMACLLTSLTTGIGFISLRAAGMPILRNFGLYAAIGIVFAYGTVLLIVPLILSLSRGTVPDAGRQERLTRVDRSLLWCARASVEHPRRVLGVTAAVTALAVLFGARVVADNKITVLLRPDHPTNLANEVAQSKLGGIIGLEIDLRAPEGSLTDPKALEALLELERWSLGFPWVRSTGGPASYVATLNQIVNGESSIPGSKEAVAQLLLLAEGDEGTALFLDEERTKARLVLRTSDVGGLAFDRFAGDVKAKLAGLLEGIELSWHVTGVPFVAYRGINHVTTDLRNSLLLAFVAIGLVIGLLFRNLRIALICFIPNALPLVFGYGFMGIMGWLLDPSPAVIFTVALGIAVDDTIHLMVRVREERAKGSSLEDAVRRSLLSAGRAVASTSLILAAGFAVNILSDFATLWTMGSLGTVVILTALLCDLFVLPSLLVVFGDRRPGEA